MFRNEWEECDLKELPDSPDVRHVSNCVPYEEITIYAIPDINYGKEMKDGSICSDLDEVVDTPKSFN